jgi:hypothetical protein
MPDIVRINQTVYSWNSTLHKFDNQPWTGVLDVAFEEKREVKIVYAAKQDGTPLGMTSGKYSVEGFTVKMLRDSGFALKKYLSDQGNGSYGDAVFDYLLQISEPTPGSPPLTTLIEGCRITNAKDSQAEGIDELVTEFTIAALLATTNDLQLWSAIRGLSL